MVEGSFYRTINASALVASLGIPRISKRRLVGGLGFVKGGREEVRRATVMAGLSMYVFGDR
jgi:hypothetical protein